MPTHEQQDFFYYQFFFISIIYNIPRFFELEWLVHIVERNESNISIELGTFPTELRRNTKYVEIYILWCDVVILGALPMMLLMYLNVQILKEMRKYKSFVLKDKNKETERKNQQQMANINLVIGSIFIICHCFRQIPSLDELYNGYKIGYPVTKWPHTEH